MSNRKTRIYKSTYRNEQATKTRDAILVAAKNLFALGGFEHTTIEKIAHNAQVSIPTIYSLFQSKCGLLRALIDEVFPQEQFDALVQKSQEAKSPKIRLHYSAKIARQLYDAEREQMDIFRGASVLAPEFKELEKEREKRRHDRQEITIQAMVEETSLSKDLTIKKARDILWTFTGRDIYRMLVIEQSWTSEEYEKWLGELLVNTLVESRS